MADISQDLQKILDAIYGEEVRGSIHHAISLINDVSEVILTTGTDITAPTDSSEGYYTGSLYLNLDTYELWKCVGTNAWQSLGILKGATGENGNKWYRGTTVSGKAVLPTVYPTGIANANANDCYLNPSEGAIYHCVTGGDDTTATWSYDFTMTGGGGGGSIVAWTQIQGATGGVKIAEIDIDGATQDVYAPEGGGGGMLPYLYIDSEAGATVTVNQPDGTTITPTAAGSGHWECELTGGYGTYVIHSVLSGQGDVTLSLAVDTVKEYHVTDTHYDFTINVTAPSGSTVRIVGGGETYTGTGTGTSQAIAVHTPSTTYTVAVTMDGNTKSETITSAATSGQSGSVNIAFGTINLTYANDFRGKTITCTKSGVTVTKTAPSSGNTMTIRVPTTGTWTISGTVSGQTYSVDAVVSSLSTAVSANLQTTINVNVTLHGAVGAVISYTDANGAQTQTLDSTGEKTNVSISVMPSSSTIVFTDTTVAKDPDNLSNNYTKSVTITDGMTDIYVMPDNALYWYGWNVGFDRTLTWYYGASPSNLDFIYDTNKLNASDLNYEDMRETAFDGEFVKKNKLKILYSKTNVQQPVLTIDHSVSDKWVVGEDAYIGICVAKASSSAAGRVNFCLGFDIQSGRAYYNSGYVYTIFTGQPSTTTVDIHAIWQED